MKKLLPLLILTFFFTSFVIILPIKQVYAAAPILKVVGGEAVDQVLTGIAYKAGQSFNDVSAKDKAIKAWNMEAYQKAVDYETKLSAEEKARWDKFNQEIKNAKVTPVPGKPGVGKVVITGLAFLTGIDLIYNAYQSFETGYHSIGYSDVAFYTPTEHPGIYISNYYNKGSTVYVDYAIGYTDGTTSTGTRTLSSTSKAPYYYKISDKGTIGFYYGDDVFVGGSNVYVDKNKELLDVDTPVIAPVPINANDLNMIRPPGFAGLPNRADSSIVPDISKLPEIDPNALIEIEVPLDPTIIPVPNEITPITPEELETLINPDPGTEPGTVPERPEPPEINKPEPEKPPELSGLDLFGWLKALLDALFKILNAIIMLPFTFVELLWNFVIDILQALFVPSDGFWDTNMNKLKALFWHQEIEDMIDEFGNVGGSGGMFKDIKVTLLGVSDLEVVDADSINKILENIHMWVRGILFPLLILFNINSIYKLIRGTNLTHVTGTGWVRRE